MRTTRSLMTYGLGVIVVAASLFLVGVFEVLAQPILNYSNTISESRPNENANHTLDFTLNTNVSPGGVLTVTPPPGFTILATSSFAARNVELYVNDVLRPASASGGAATDTVAITPGTPGQISYTLNPTTGLSDGDQLTLLIGSHTSQANIATTTFSTSTGTTTTSADIGIDNASATGTHEVNLTISGADVPTETDFVIFLLEPVGIENVDTTETVPPVRSNGAPEGIIGGTTAGVELSLQTDELAVCRYSTTPGVDYNSMTNAFDTTGQLLHIEEIAVENETTYTFYVRCIDDEGNFNTDDYIISFTVPEAPTGIPDPDAEQGGDGTGAGGGEGSGGDGGGSGTDSGSSSGSGGGGGGGSGGGSSSGSRSGGGFDSDGPYESGEGQVIINGRAFPNADVTVLVDGQEAESARARSDGDFTVTIEDIARGSYNFGIFATDSGDGRTGTFSTTFQVQGARTFTLSDITLSPSIDADPDPVDPGEPVTLSGFTLPNSTLTIENERDGSAASLRTLNATADSGGRWSITLETDGFSAGTYQARARAVTPGGETTTWSAYARYGVGQSAAAGIEADLNRDGSVNITDFSILLFWWGGDGGDSDPPADINQDGTVSLTDFSIMLFNWTG